MFFFSNKVLSNLSFSPSLSPDSWPCSEPWWTGWRLIKTGDCLISHAWCTAFGSLSWDQRSCRRCNTALLRGQSLTLFSLKLHNVHQISFNRCRTASCCSGVQEGKQRWKLWKISCMLIGEHQTANHEHRTRYITDSCHLINKHSWKIQLLHKINKKAKLVISSQFYSLHTTNSLPLFNFLIKKSKPVGFIVYIITNCKLSPWQNAKCGQLYAKYHFSIMILVVYQWYHDISVFLLNLRFGARWRSLVEIVWMKISSVESRTCACGLPSTSCAERDSSEQSSGDL